MPEHQAFFPHQQEQHNSLQIKNGRFYSHGAAAETSLIIHGEQDKIVWVRRRAESYISFYKKEK